MLQIQPSEEIIDEYLSDDCADYKYLRALAAFYLRLTAKSPKLYRKLEPLLNDYRKLRVRNPDGSYTIIHMDEFIESLLNNESLFEVTLPALIKRKILEQNGEVEPRVSLLEADLDLDELMKDQRLERKNENIQEDYLDDLNLDNIVAGHNYEKDSDSSSDSESEKYSKNKKRRLEETDHHEKSDNKSQLENIDEKLKKLDPNSAEYWLEMRKKIGLS
jgi:pre-mRNA-splicing factor 38A